MKRELTNKQQETLEKRLNFLISKREKLKEIINIHQWEEAHRIISFSLAQEESFKEEHKNYNDIMIVGLRRAKREMDSTRDLMLKNKKNKAADTFWSGLEYLLLDYDNVIRMIEYKVNLKQFFAGNNNEI